MRILLPSLLFVAACTPSANELAASADREAGQRADLDRELAGLVPGQTQTCVEQTRVRNAKGYGSTIVYSTPGRERFVTQTSGGCERFGDDAILVTRTPSTQLCRGNSATLIDRASRQPVGACIFGDFTSYRPAPANPTQ